MISAIVNNFKPEYSENILPITALVTDNTTVNYFEDGEVLISDDYQFSDNKSLKLEMTLSATTLRLNDFNLGSSLSKTVKYNGRYIFSFRFLDKTATSNFVEITIGFNVFINSVLTHTFQNVIDINTYEDDKFYTIAQSFDLNANDEVDFSFFVIGEQVSPPPIVNLYFSGFKLELDDRFLGIPSIYSKPIATQVSTQVGNLKIISFLSDLPTAVSSIITLEDNVTYFIADTIDLNGSRLVGSANTVIIGGSSENSILTSTGLGVGVPLLSSIYTTPIRHIAINDVDTAIEFDGSTNPNDMALDWTGVNFVNVPNVGLVKDASNFIFDKGAFLNSKGLSFDGTIGTVGFGNSLFSGDGLAGDLLRIESTCTITRRFRIIYSSVVAFGSTTGLNVNVSATIPNQSYILDTVNFSGGGTYLSGLDSTSNKSLFNNCVGIQNTASRGFMFMVNNTTNTTIGVPNVDEWVKASGTTTEGSLNSQFTHSNNRLTYTGSLSQSFHIVVCANVRTSSTNQVISIGIAVNGTIITDSEMTIRTSNANQEYPGATQYSINLTNNDYVELFVKNTSSTDVRVSDFNMNIANISS